jgi:hypothetical protein
MLRGDAMRGRAEIFKEAVDSFTVGIYGLGVSGCDLSSPFVYPIVSTLIKS